MRFFPFSRVFIFIFILLFISCCQSESNNYSLCSPSSCGNLNNISFPFRLKNDPNNCGDPDYELDCKNNNQTIITFNSKKFFLQSISYTNLTIRVVDPCLINTTNDCSFPVNSAMKLFDDIPIQTYNEFHQYKFKKRRIKYLQYDNNNLPIAFISCVDPISYSSSSRYIDISFCRGQNTTGFWNPSRTYGYIGVVKNTRISDLPETCGVEEVAFVSSNGPLSTEKSYSSLVEIYQGLAYGFELSWNPVLCRDCEANHGYCSLVGNTKFICENYCPKIWFRDWFQSWIRCIRTSLITLSKFRLFSRFELGTRSLTRLGFRCKFKFYAPIVLGFVIRAIAGLLLLRVFTGYVSLMVLVVHKWRRRHLSGDETIEGFLQEQTNILPIKYSYSDIKKMTNKFKQKLGEGGYGIVYRGKLRSGTLVAVKMTNKSISSEQEFSNEVGTIGRVHHVNVVQLIGFCNEGSKRALVYEYMPNGSLDKYIYPAPGLVALTYKNMFDISLGVARGIDYLHKGCDMQILHFDIKPHNILLDEDFKPKVSDFGLAKLYPTDVNTVSLPTTTARGTTGYMAPELFYKNIGGVSYKADVYSFGMLLMELASRKENINPFAEDDGQIYFPSWVYDQLNDRKEIDMGNVCDEERMMVKKMIKVALWCIQMKPGNRPSMNKVVEMLEGDDQLVHMPPRPFIAPHGITKHEHR